VWNLDKIIEPTLHSKRSVAYDSVHDKVEFKRMFNSTVRSYLVVQFFLSLKKCFICDNTNSPLAALLQGNQYKKQMSLLKFGDLVRESNNIHN